MGVVGSGGWGSVVFHIDVEKVSVGRIDPLSQVPVVALLLPAAAAAVVVIVTLHHRFIP